MGFQVNFLSVDASKVTPLLGYFSFDDGTMIDPLTVTIYEAKIFPDLKKQKS